MFSGKGRASALFCLLLAGHGALAATASGRSWRISVDRIACEGGLLAVDARVDYLGTKGPVEAPVHRLVDAEARTYPPKSLVWQGGDKRLAQWLPSGGIANIQAERIGEFQLRFEIGAATSALQLEFGDIRAFALTGKGGCKSVLKPAQLVTPRKARPGNIAPVKSRVYRGAYPCTPRRTVEADHPPHLPRQLLLLGHGFLPSAREVDFPTGKAPAQPYFYQGTDNLVAVENAARQAIAADFPEYRGEKFFPSTGVRRSRGAATTYTRSASTTSGHAHDASQRGEVPGDA